MYILATNWLKAKVNEGYGMKHICSQVDKYSGTTIPPIFSFIHLLDFPAAIPTSDPAATCDFSAGPGFKWGYGLLLNTADLPGMRRAWSGAWAGLCNTHFWVDRTTGVTGAIYSNFLPFVTPEAMTMYQDFERALYASL